MSGFSAKANELLVEIYRNVQILEQNELKKQRLNISINEIHMIELIAKGKTGMTVSEIAQHLKVTKPSVTVAVNKLVQKGYCEKQRLPGDGRAGMLGIVGQTVQQRCIVRGEKIGAAAALPGLDRNGLELLPIVVGDIPRTHGAAIDRAVVREDQNAVLGHLHVQLRHVDAHADGRSDRQQRIFRCHAPRCAMRNAHRHAGGKLGHAVLRTMLRHRIGDDCRRHELHKQQHDQQDVQ